MIEIMKRILSGVGLALVLLLVVAPVVLAIDDPDVVLINSSYCFASLLEDDDRLIIADYTITYDPAEPDDPIDEVFFFKLLDDTKTEELGVVTAYPYYNNGYGTGVIGFYFSAADNLTWEDTYYIRISGNPVHYPAWVDVDYEIPALSWYSSEEKDPNQTALAAQIIDYAGDLEVAWSATLLQSTDVGSTVLNASGATYFNNAIPGLNFMAPAAYATQIVDMVYTDRDWGTDQADAYKDQFVGTWVQDSMDAIAELTTFNVQFAMSIPILLGMLALVIMSKWQFDTPMPGVIDALTFRYLGVFLGWVSMGVSMLVTFLFAVLLGWILLFEKS